MPETFKVAQNHSTSVRVDVWLALVSSFSRSRIKTLMAAGAVRCDGAPVRDPARHVRPGECYAVDPPPPAPVVPVAQAIPLDILYEDEAVIVVNKPPALVVHPAAGHPDGTLVNALLAHCPGLFSVGGEARPGIVHRLDQDTSGALVVAKTDAAMAALSDAFQSGRVHKTYQTLVHGVPVPEAGRVETLIGRHPVHRQRMAVVTRNGRTAVTRWRVMEVFADTALLEVVIETGRTHQIRVHMRHLGCPVAGDAVYGRPRLDARLPTPPARQMLHAWRLAFPHPLSGRRLAFEAPPPDDFCALLAACRAARG